MRIRTWPILFIGFGVLLGLIALSAAALHNRMGKVYAEVASIQERERVNRRLLNQLRTELYQAAILVRDYLLEPSALPAAEERKELEALRRSVERDVSELENAVRASTLDQNVGMRNAILRYWASMDPIFQWTPKEKAAQGRDFLRRSVVPYRDAVLAATQWVGDVNSRQTLERQQQILQTQEDLKSDLRSIAGLALALGFIVALFSIVRTRSLEASAAVHLDEIERHAAELRRLSQMLAKAQEDERRSLSRELHDQVGQMLTALSMELGNLEERRLSQEEFDRHMVEARKLNQDTLRTVRNISSGLRPSVLDQLGLAPALQWQAREFSRRSGVPVELQLDGELEDLTDEHRTCIYRVVQEALTNAARHAKAKSIRLTLHGGPELLSLTVEDDGSGFDIQQARGRGSGLLNIEERLKELGGNVQFLSAPSQGTLIRCEMPVTKEVTA